MKATIQRRLCRLYLRHATPCSLTVFLCLSLGGCLLVYLALHGKQALEQKHSARQLWLQQHSLDAMLVEDTNRRCSSVVIQSDVRFKGHFTSPFVVAGRIQEQPVDNEVYNDSTELTAISTRAIRNKTFAIIWPCKGHTRGCFIHAVFPTQMCSFRCQQTWRFEQADVVVFNVFRFRQNDEVPTFNRPRHQRWAMMTIEAPVRVSEFSMLDFPVFRGQFNWTITYRLDSDIPRLYGRLQRQDSLAKDYSHIYRGKTVAAAWFVSHCVTQSNRQMYVERMQAIMDVHVYGSCGNYTCINSFDHKRDLDKDQCLPLLSKRYFFYLAFENSFCKDYVTEKLFKIFEDVDVIPVVRGGVDYKRYFPEDTFVDASDFKSPEDLAVFLLDVAKDKNRYISMLKKKNRYGVLPEQRWFCDMCERMHTDTRETFYPDLRHWYIRGQCHEPNDM